MHLDRCVKHHASLIQRMRLGIGCVHASWVQWRIMHLDRRVTHHILINQAAFVTVRLITHSIKACGASRNISDACMNPDRLCGLLA